ncbi:hypothetical protein [Symmachiella macrocystis]|uniref:hypothetical protein n=1 Tax=Symmachiella macrocystis TaxID=2527985 RepID=UPI0011B6D686|nr:hypothetical protein [Symmachiella macrocystis]
MANHMPIVWPRTGLVRQAQEAVRSAFLNQANTHGKNILSLRAPAGGKGRWWVFHVSIIA